MARPKDKVKGLTDVQKSKLKEIEEQHQDLKIIDHLTFGKLFHPDVFPESNKYRLHKEVENSIQDYIQSFHYAFRELPYRKKIKIVRNPSFKIFISHLLGQLDYARQVRTTDKKFQQYAFDIYLDFFEIGIDGLIGSLPKDFQKHLKAQLEPILSLMRLIGKYEGQNFKYPITYSKKKVVNPS